MRVRTWLGTLIVATCPPWVAAQPAGGEFRINSYTTGNQNRPSVASDASGNYVVVWWSYLQDGSNVGVFGQRFNAAGVAQGAEFQVNSYTTSFQRFPSVALDASGNFVVVWESNGQDGSSYGIFGQRFDAAGITQGAEFRVNSHTTSSQGKPSVASDASGNFVVVWDSLGQDGSNRGIFGRRFDPAGIAQGAEFRVNSYTTQHQSWPWVASDPNGNFVVVWESSSQDDGSTGVFGQRFDAAGNAQGAEFPVNSYTTGIQRLPSVVSDVNGNFIVVWGSTGQDGSTYGVFGQRFDAAGIAQGAEFQVNSYTTDKQYRQSVASDANGNFVVVWDSVLDQDGDSTGVFGQRFDASGMPQGSEFRVNSYTTGAQSGPSVASNEDGDFVVVWASSPYQEGGGSGVFGQRYGDLIFQDGFE